MAPSRTLVTGGVRSGKSGYAERLLTKVERVRYVAPGPVPDPAVDAEWADRVARHRERRPARWQTVETTDLVLALADPPAAVLIDCLGTWVTAVVDELGAWDEPLAQWQPDFDARLTGLVEAWTSCPATLVAVTNEVGWGVVAAYRSGRTFADLLGRTNATLARHCDDVVLMVAGRPLRI
ncbi:MAG: bifunctional adenosylcobinamide kinase/adenosylcobinamide-phosphate guanylyltransferase [Propionibacteriaceae bacterium]